MPGLHAYDVREDYIIYESNDEIVKNVNIMHFAQQNPWDKGKKTDAFKIWWDYARKTPYYEDLLWETYWKSEEYVIPTEERMEANENKLRYIDKILDEYENKTLVQYFDKRGFKKIAIYGAGRIARILSMCIKSTSIEIICYIDREMTGTFYERPIFEIKGAGDIDADCIVVSNPAYFKEVQNQLKTNLPIISLEEVLQDTESKG